MQEAILGYRNEISATFNSKISPKQTKQACINNIDSVAAAASDAQIKAKKDAQICTSCCTCTQLYVALQHSCWYTL